MSEETKLTDEKIAKTLAATHVSRVDMLSAENQQLRVMNLSLRRQALLNELHEVTQRIQEAQSTLVSERERIAEKYFIDFNTHEIEAGTGRIIQRAKTVSGEHPFIKDPAVD